MRIHPCCLAALAALTPNGVAAGGKQIIAVFDIETSGISLSKPARDRLGDYLTTKIAAIASYQVVPRSQLRKRLRRQKRDSYKACYDQSCQIEIGRELAAQKSLSTKVLRLGKQCIVTLALYDLRKSATERGADATGGCGIGALVRSLETAVHKLTAGAGPALPSKPLGVVDRKHCPKPGTRRMGEPYPDGSYIWCVDSKGVRQGLSLQWLANGQLIAKGHYRDNKQHGLWITFHRNGKKSTEVSYRDGKQQGRFVRYDMHGNRSEIGQYRGGVKVGTWLRFDSDGNKRYEEPFVNDDKHGVAHEYYASGNKRCLVTYRKGERHGLFVAWKESGEKERQGHYRNDKRHGRWERFWGSSREVTSYRDGKRWGPSVRYRDGNKVEEGSYGDDKREGKWTYYSRGRDGMYKYREGPYRADKMHGRWTHFRPDGKKSTETEYRGGKRNGRHVVYRSEGSIMTEDHYRDDKRNGRHVSYDRQGQIQVEGSYRNNKRHGRWRYYRNGQLQRETTFEDGRRI